MSNEKLRTVLFSEDTYTFGSTTIQNLLPFRKVYLKQANIIALERWKTWKTGNFIEAYCLNFLSFLVAAGQTYRIFFLIFFSLLRIDITKVTHLNYALAEIKGRRHKKTESQKKHLNCLLLPTDFHSPKQSKFY